MARENREDRYEVESLYAGYTVYDVHYEKIGEVDDLFVDEEDRPEYVGVKMGFLGLRSTLIPWEMVRVNEKRGLIEVSESKDRVKDAPTFDSDEEITPEIEEQVYRYFGLQREGGFERSAYGAYYRNEDYPSPPATTDDVERGGEVSRPNIRKRARDRRPDVSGERVEAGAERAPEEGGREASSRGGEEEIVVPVVEERIVIRKRPVVKERIVIRKRVVEDEELVDVPVRKEEVEIEDETTRRDA
ncbi:MAG: PRC and DUF2382 domain-containing protein [Actinobacteria bacterium]|nr:PRC and DUF2382 domain-containing protein [Actinomycetota bacterium]